VTGTAAEAILQGLPVLSGLPPDVRDLVVASFVPIDYGFGKLVVTEGQPADALYVLVSGRARVVKRGENGDEVSLGSLRPGDTFGEGGFFEHEGLHPATVRTSSDVEALRLDRTVFEALLRRRPEVREFFELQARHRHLEYFFRQFTDLSKLPPEALNALLRELEPIEAGKGEVIFNEGDPAGPLYIVEDGRFRAHAGVGGRRRNVAFFRRGEFFGERSVFRDEPREFTVEAVMPGRLLRLTHEAYASLLEQHPELADAIEARLGQYDFQHTAQIPIDLFRELLPAEAQVTEKVSETQVDQDLTQVWQVPKELQTTSGTLGQLPGPTIEASTAQAVPTEEPKERRSFARRIFGFPHLHQVDEMDCAATSLAIVCRYYGKNLSLARIRQLVHTGNDGASLRAICEGANELGLSARAVKASPVGLAQLPLPAVVHWDGNHWVVLYDVSDTHVRISDPAIGKRRMTRAEFEHKWSGYAALFDYTERFEQNVEARPGIAWILPYFQPYKTLLAQATALALIVSLLEMVIPVFTQVIVDRVVVERDVTLLHVLVAGMGAMLVFTLLATVVQRYLLSFVAVRVDDSR